MTINENHKKGLHVIKTVLELKGKKRFKKTGDTDNSNLTTDDLNLDVSANNAKEILRKMTHTTSYCMNFGDRPKAAQDFNVLKEKQFSKLPAAQVLKPGVREMLTRWLAIND